MTTEPKRNNRIHSDTRKNIWLILTLVTYGITIVALGIYAYWFHKHEATWSLQGPIRFIFDDFDLQVYIRSSRWITGSGTLYKDVPSEYPLAANLIFGGIRALAIHGNFAQYWIISGIVVLIGCATLAWRDGAPGFFWAWALPGAIFFAAFRYDIYPAFFIMACLAAMKRKLILAGALLLGIAISLKGYALFMLPCMLVYTRNQRGTKKALLFLLLSVSPYIAMNIITIGFSGIDGFLSAYKFHAQRSFNGQNLYDAFGLQSLIIAFPGIPKAMAVISSLTAALLRPKTFEQLISTCLLSVTGFTLAVPFYSPQFCLWLLSIASFSLRTRILLPVFTLSASAYFYYPISWDSPIYKQDFIRYSVLFASATRLIIFASCLPVWQRKRFNSSVL